MKTVSLTPDFASGRATLAAGLAAALGVSIETVKLDQWGDLVCESDDTAWTLFIQRQALRYDDSNAEIVISIPVTRSFAAAVSSIRAALAALKTTGETP